MKNLFCGLILLCSFSLVAQSAWRKGIVTLPDGTELRGEILDLEWTKNPSEIEFRSGGEVKKYNVKTIVSFSTERPARYEAHFVSYDNDLQTSGQLPATRNAQQLKNDTVFTEVIVHAPVSLHFLADLNGRHHFFIQTDQAPLEELRFRKFLIGDAIALNQDYKQQLFLMVKDCKSGTQLIRNLAYTESGLRKLVETINACRNNPVEKVWDGEITKRQPELGFTVFSFFNRTEYLGFSSPMGRANPGAGVFIEGFSRKKPNRQSLYTEFIVSKVNQGITNGVVVGKLSFTRIRLLAMGRFSYLKPGGSRVFWGLGLAGNLYSDTQFGGLRLPPDYYSSTSRIGPVVGVGATFPVRQTFKITPEVRFAIDNFPVGPIFFGSNVLEASIQIAFPSKPGSH